MSCRPGSHSFAPLVKNGIAVIFCAGCGEVRDILPRVEVQHGYSFEAPPTADPLPHPVVAAPQTEDLERSVQALEADVLERLRDGLGNESWSSIMQRAGMDPGSDFARSLAVKVGAQQAAFEDKPAMPGFRASVTGLPPEEQALIEESNRHEQRRIVVDESELQAGL